MKNNIVRVILFLVLVFVGFSGPVWLFIIGVAGYIFMYLGYEIIILAAAIDAYFGYASDGWFVYTILVSVGLFCMQWLKPHLSVYNQ